MKSANPAKMSDDELNAAYDAALLRKSDPADLEPFEEQIEKRKKNAERALRTSTLVDDAAIKAAADKEKARRKAVVEELQTRLVALGPRVAKHKERLDAEGAENAAIMAEWSELYTATQNLHGTALASADCLPNLQHASLIDMKRSGLPTRNIATDHDAHGLNEAIAYAISTLQGELNAVPGVS